jgi:hypothetical protein
MALKGRLVNYTNSDRQEPQLMPFFDQKAGTPLRFISPALRL